MILNTIISNYGPSLGTLTVPNAGKIAELGGLDRKEVDKAMKQLKEEGAIVSPMRCKWAPAQ